MGWCFFGGSRLLISLILGISLSSPTGEGGVREDGGRREVTCTLYYTPRESGFRASDGFDVTPETRPGLEGRMFPRDFLRAVKMEGCGRIANPHKGHSYILYGRTQWRYIKHPLGNKGQKLEPRRSCAVSRRAPWKTGDILLLDSNEIQEVFGSVEWEVMDSGSGLEPDQIDLYWGEDDPLAPGRHIARPKGTLFEFAFNVPVEEVESK
jgi:hypothetical protein